MNRSLCWLLTVRIFLLPLVIIQGYEPEFSEPLNNLTVAVGRDATFSCVVEHLGGYRVGWVKADTKAIQAIHEHVITHNPRVAVSHSDHSTWNLHLRNVQEEDRGTYMCQINTDPMKSEMGFLDVVVPPDIIDEESSVDVMVPEGGSVTLTCKARGYPEPDITWKREDRSKIVFREAAGIKNAVLVHEGSLLKLTKISRSDMGHYMCMASNGVPPAVSKRISVNVHFAPVIQVPNQLVGAPLGTDVTLECFVEASPKAIMYWTRDTSDNMIVSSDKFETKSIVKSMFETKMMLKVFALQKPDVGTYRCVAKNSLGEVERSIRLYEIPGAVGRRNHQVVGNAVGAVVTDDQEEEDEDESGSADSGLPAGAEAPPSHSPGHHHHEGRRKSSSGVGSSSVNGGGSGSRNALETSDDASAIKRSRLSDFVIIFAFIVIL